MTSPRLTEKVSPPYVSYRSYELLLRAEVRRMRRQGDGPADEDLADIELQEDAA